jgi:hypothetical protein
LLSLGTREEEPESLWYAFADGRSLRFATQADVKPAFFDAQPPEERKLKEKRFGPALGKTAGKRGRETSGRVVERLAKPIAKEEEVETEAKSNIAVDAPHEIVVVDVPETTSPERPKEDEDQEIDIQN